MGGVYIAARSERESHGAGNRRWQILPPSMASTRFVGANTTDSRREREREKGGGKEEGITRSKSPFKAQAGAAAIAAAAAAALGLGRTAGGEG